ncbi:cysteine desulfurase family protein [Leptospira ilyithenensis]|uniref:Aminotransferase class V-fold PLP-dependent enzyme n=1 Tax=Leptospira ilyithenensis TaxID=2484901 RepID=A0A4R9LQJ1_9LEPT|nr:aminotransferase class V-fold PLP-dependent enzyme [Leptospira ilyithenensis]TGN10022.1 aminotransferase class V-fold PLP-dependent enzyme [Leptospira ilyithenensis]
MKSPSQSKFFYFDYNATHPPFLNFLTESLNEYAGEYYNPSGATRFSLRNQGKIESVRKYFAGLTGKNERGFVFSSTGTEANYLLLRYLRESNPDLKELIVSPFEHSSMYSAIRDLGFSPRLIQTDFSGVIDLKSLRSLLLENPVPILCLYAGNETGVLQPVERIASLAKEFGVSFFSDLMQAFGKIHVDFSLFDGFSFSSHKIGGGLGSALSFVPNTKIDYHVFGGGNQENGHRAGTENIQALLSFQKSTEFQMKHLSEKEERLKKFQIQIETRLETLGCKIIAKDSPRLPNTSFVMLPLEDIDFFLLGMEEKNTIISTGSSCKSRAREASSSLIAMGYSKEEALRCIRISTGIHTTQDEIDFLSEASEELILKFKSF